MLMSLLKLEHTYVCMYTQNASQGNWLTKCLMVAHECLSTIVVLSNVWILLRCYEIDWKSRIIAVTESYVVLDKPAGTSVSQWSIHSLKDVDAAWQGSGSVSFSLFFFYLIEDMFRVLKGGDGLINSLKA